MPSMNDVKLLITIPDYQDDSDHLERIAAVSPRVRVVRQLCDYPDDVAPMLRDVEILYTRSIPSHLRCADRLRWVALHFSGIDHGISDSPIFDPENNIVVTNVAGAHAVHIAEYTMAVMTMLARGFVRIVLDQQARKWDPHPERQMELRGKTVGIVGYGQIGREIGRLAHAYGMTVLVLKRRSEQRRATGFQWSGLGDPQGAIPQRFFGNHQLHEMLGLCDFVVNCLPHTPATRRLFDHAAFAAMKRGTIMVNVGRGETLDRDALLAALQSGQLAAASMDAFECEPNALPPDDRLWSQPNLLITPHIAGTRMSELYRRLTIELFCENLRRYLQGQLLLNRVTRADGY